MKAMHKFLITLLVSSGVFLLFSPPSFASDPSRLSLNELPNLVEESSSLEFRNDSLFLKVSVENLGPVASGTFSLGIYASENPVIGSSDYLMTDAAFPSLGENATHTATFELALCDYPALIDGAYTIGFFIDYLREVRESEEGLNNKIAFDNGLVEKSCSEELPNLTATEASLDLEGNKLSVDIEVINNGLIASGPFKVGIFASENDLVGSSDFLIGSVDIASLAPNASSGTIIDINVCDFPDLVDGTYYLGYFIEYEKLIDETDEGTDNKGTFNQQLEKICPVGLPNLTAGNISLNASGNELNFTLEVLNEGGSPSGDFFLGIYASENGSISTSDFLIGELPVVSIPAGGSESAQTSIDLCNISSLSNGTYTIGIIVDHTKIVNETDEGDNNEKFTPTRKKECEDPLPELVPGNTALSISNTEVSITVEVVNEGAGSSGAFDLGFYASENSSISTSDFLLGSSTFPSLGPGERLERTEVFELCDFEELVDTDFTLGFIIDYLKVVEEEKENNNNGKFNQKVNKDCAEALADLVGESPQISIDESVVNLVLDVVNIGEREAENVLVRFYASENVSINTSDFLLDEFIISSLPGSSRENVSVKLDLCGIIGLQEGTYTLGYLIDPLNDIPESNEDNNDGTFLQQASKSCPVLLPDLANTSASLTVNGTELTVNIELSNLGEGNAAPFSLGLYASSNTSISTADFLLGTLSYGALGPGDLQSQEGSFDLCNFPSLESGIFTIGFIIDPEKEIEESEEGNNNGRFEGQTVEKNCVVEGPNLSIQSSSLEITGATVGIEVIIINTGTARAKASTISYYASADGSIETTDFLLGTKVVDALSPGETDDNRLVINLCALARLPLGSYTVGFILDPENEVPETDEQDNEKAFPSQAEKECGELGANLLLKASEMRANDALVELSLILENDGTGAAENFDIAFFVSENTSISVSDPLLGTFPVSRLEAGGRIAVDMVFDLCQLTNVSNGNHTIGIIADYLKLVPEVRRDDNRAKFSERVNKTCPSGGPNLLAGVHSLNQTGTELQLDLEILNDGNANSGDFTLSLYASSNSTISSFDFLLAEENISSIPANGSQSTANFVDLCVLDVLPPGTYTIGYFIDRNADVEESNESDNLGSFSSQAEKNCTVVVPNLRFSNTTWTETDNGIEVAFEILNDGTNASGNFSVGIYLSTDADISVSDTRLGSKEFSSLSPGSQAASDFSFDLCEITDLVQGTYFVGVWVDDKTEVSESNEADNVDNFDSPITRSCIDPQANLTGIFPKLVVNQNIVEIDLSVLNEGTADADPFQVVFYASPDTMITPDDVFLARQEVLTLQVGEVFAMSFARDLCEFSDLAPGMYYLGYFIDRQGIIDESDEDDNIDTFEPSVEKDCVEPLPNLLIGSSTFNLEGTVANFAVSIENAGGADAGPFTVSFYASENASIEPSDFALASLNIPFLSQGSTTQALTALDLCSIPSLEDGTYTFGFFIDPTDEIEELEEQDNGGSYTEPVEKTCVVPEPNLVLGAPSLEVDGNTLNLNIEVMNTGNSESGPFSLGVYASENALINVSDFLMEELSFASIPPGTTGTQEVNIDLCSVDGLTAGIYSLGLVVDKENAVEETEESDNVFAYDTEINKNCGDQIANIAINFTNIVPIGSLLEIDIEVKNTGSLSSPGFTVAFFASENFEINASDFLLGTETFPALDPNQRKGISKIIKLCEVTDLPPGDYTIGYILDIDNEVPESSEEDNVKAFPQTVTKACNQARPNLGTRSANFSINNNVANINLSVVNDGGAPAGPFKVSFFASEDEEIGTDDFAFLSMGFNGLSQGNYATQNNTLDLCEVPGFPQGDRYIGYIIDVEEDVFEISEGDNLAAFPDVATVDCSQRGPNLRTLSSNMVVEESNIELDLTLINTGSEASGNFIVAFIASENSSLGASDFVFAIQSVSNLGPGDTLSSSRFVDLCSIANLAPWEYTIGYIIDFQENVDEFNEIDNVRIFENKAEKDCSTRAPDLLVNNSNISVNENAVSINLSVKNVGTSASEPVKLGLYASENDAISLSDFFLVEQSYPVLQAGQEITTSIVLDLCSFESLSNGTYSLGYFVDYLEELEEENEENNANIFAATVEKNCIPPMADLVIGSSSASLLEDSILTIRHMIRNQGELATESFSVAYFASTDTEITASDFPLWLREIGSIAPGDSFLVEFSASPCDLPGFIPGTYAIGYILDINETVEELDEGDNTEVLLGPTEIRCRTVGIEDLLGDNSINVFPNPFQEGFMLTFSKPLHETISLDLYNSLGQRMNTWDLAIGKTKSWIGIQDLPEGIYYLQIQTEGGKHGTVKLMKYE